jgi:hypothetical protein
MEEKELDLDIDLVGFGESILLVSYTAKDTTYDHETEPHFDFYIDKVERKNKYGDLDNITQYIGKADMDIIKNECEDYHYQCISDLQYGDY